MLRTLSLLLGLLLTLPGLAQPLPPLKVQLLGHTSVPTGTMFQNTAVGGLSGISYDPLHRVYWVVSDDRSEKAPARVYKLALDLRTFPLTPEQVQIQEVITLQDRDRRPFAIGSMDGEGIALSPQNTLWLSSEGLVKQKIEPFVAEFALNGTWLREIRLPLKFRASQEVRGVRDNLAFESLTLTPSGRYLYTAPENALVQDGPVPGYNQTSPSRLLQINLVTGKPIAEWLYPVSSLPNKGIGLNGLVDLVALNDTTLLSLERAYFVGVGNIIRLFMVNTEGATNLQAHAKIPASARPVRKRLLWDSQTSGLQPDNLEGMTLGPKLPDGQRTLILIGDNNFNPLQTTQIVVLGINTKISQSGL